MTKKHILLFLILYSANLLPAEASNQEEEISQSLKRRKLEIYVTDKNGNTLIHLAATDNDLPTVEWAVLQNPKLSMAKNHKGLLPLHCAAQHNAPATAQWLLQQNPESILAPDSDGWLPLHYAAYSGALQVVLDIIYKEEQLQQKQIALFQQDQPLKGLISEATSLEENISTIVIDYAGRKLPQPRALSCNHRSDDGYYGTTALQLARERLKKSVPKENQQKYQAIVTAIEKHMKLN